MISRDLRRRILEMPETKWDVTRRAIRTNGFLVLAAIVVAAMLTELSFRAIAEAGYADAVPRVLCTTVKIVLNAATIAVGAALIAVEILRIQRERIKKETP